MRRTDPVFVAGAGGLLGSAIVRRLAADGFTNVLTPGRDELDLTRWDAVESFFERARPVWVFLSAARVGGILANRNQPAEFLRENLLIQTHVIDAARRAGVRRLFFPASSCMYPRLAPQPMREEYLLTGPLEPTNSAYAVAKIAGVEMCAAYRRQYGFATVVAVPTNLYGPGDRFDAQEGHVIAALMRRFHEAREARASRVVVWGSGRQRREFLFADDAADAAVFLMQHYEEGGPINVGVGRDLSIGELARLIADVVGFRGEVLFDPSHPDGAPRKLLDCSRVSALGWRPRTPLAVGLERTYAWYRHHVRAGPPRDQTREERPTAAAESRA
jgi:GDP-L-fucose synthase